MRLSELITGIDGDYYNVGEVDVTSLEFDSRCVKPGSLFIAMTGERFDGHDFIDDATQNGAVAVVTERRVKTTLPLVVVRDTRLASGRLARTFYGNFDDMSKIGVTGTNGKTTTTFLIHSILKAAGRQPGLIGTVYYRGKAQSKAVRTTPESLDLFKLMHLFAHEGAQAVVMEVSSHALSLKRVEEIMFDVAVFTNLSQDHLDFHKTIDEYRNAKLHIFSLLGDAGTAVFNLDDETSEAIQALHLKKTITYGVRHRGTIRGEIMRNSIDGLTVAMHYKEKKYTIQSQLIGDFNIYNICAACGVGIALGINFETVVHGIEALHSVRGRMERVVGNVFVDYAHTPSAIEHVLKSLRYYTNGRIIIVFGCGGDRDKDKRPKMGALAAELADLTILTADNPRSEAIHDIIRDIEKGIGTDNHVVIENRREAIRFALSSMGQDDIVLIAGKGHEEYQTIGDKTIEFDDAKVVRECFEHL